jgi:transposase InsO family protein
VSSYRFIEAEKVNWPVRLLCRTLGVARSAYYEWSAEQPSERDQQDAVLAVHIRAMHRRSRGTYGSPRIHADLVAEGHDVGRNRVARLMRDLGLSGTPKRRFKGCTTDSDHDDRVAENVLERDFTAERPNQAWVGDITYLPTNAGWVYLAVLIDLFSRKVVGWALASHMETELCLEALHRAVVTREPDRGLLHHTDRGSQYTSNAYQAALTSLGAVPSMSRKGNCWDNAVAESFFGTLEQELVNRSEAWADEEECRAAVSDYIHAFYNAQRRHSTLGQHSPVEFEAMHRDAQRRAA